MKFNIDGVPAPVQFSRVVPGCGQAVIGIHGFPGVPADANFRTTVTWPGAGGATVIMRAMAYGWQVFWTQPVMPPVLVLR